ncbi:MAG: L-threonylcarbamoyladenylate synthase [Aerococcaceae bacterium]|nr:L-threonylcarbamoyladenylate synthase [Aerococcaceae bacterium]
MSSQTQRPMIYTADQIDVAAACLRGEELVAFPTETVFGLGAIAHSDKAVERVFQAKGRPSDNPLIVHVASVEAVDELVAEVNEMAARLMQTFWPGPLTIIFPAKEGMFSSYVSAGKDTVALRMPDHADTLRLIETVGFPLVGPSANVSGRPSPTSVEHVVHDFQDKIAGVLQSKTPLTAIGVESTVVYPHHGVIHILRPGVITKSMLAQLGYPVEEVTATQQLLSDTLVSPGVKYTHYSPEQPVYVLPDMPWDSYFDRYSDQKIGLLALESACQHYQQDAYAVYSLGNTSQSATQRLYAGLRELEKSGVGLILAQGLDTTDEANHAYMNRLEKAASAILQ